VSVKYRVEAVKSGRLEEKEIVVMHWLFKKREFLSTVKLAPGQRCRLLLVPWAESLDAYTKTLLDNFDALDSFFQESPEIMP
jgi:hypothetical protein